MPIGFRNRVLLASDVVQGAIPEPTFDMNLARRAIRDAPLTDRGTDLLPAITKAMDVLRDRLASAKRSTSLPMARPSVGANSAKSNPRSRNQIRNHHAHQSSPAEHEEQNLASAISAWRAASHP